MEGACIDPLKDRADVLPDPSPNHAAADALVPPPGRVWYTAYGSNMSYEQLLRRVGPIPPQAITSEINEPSTIPSTPPQWYPPSRIAVVAVPRRQMLISAPSKTPGLGYANVETIAPGHDHDLPKAPAATSGYGRSPPYALAVAYELSEAQLRRMDAFEDAPNKYRRTVVRAAVLAADVPAPPMTIDDESGSPTTALPPRATPPPSHADGFASSLPAWVDDVSACEDAIRACAVPGSVLEGIMYLYASKEGFGPDPSASSKHTSSPAVPQPPSDGNAGEEGKVPEAPTDADGLLPSHGYVSRLREGMYFFDEAKQRLLATVSDTTDRQSRLRACSLLDRYCAYLEEMPVSAIPSPRARLRAAGQL